MSTSRDSLIGLPPSIVSTTASSRARSWMMRESRKMYRARRDGARRDQPSNALSAAFTAWSTSISSASTTSESFCSVAGLMVGKRFWLWGATILPPMNSPYRGSILTWSMDSGAGAYSKVRFANSVGARFAIAISVDREVVTGLVGAGALLLDLHQHVVEQRGRAKPEPLWSHPLGSERLVQHNEVGDRLLGGADTARGLDADRAPGLAHEVADRLHHHQAHGQGRGGLHLAGGRLDEVGARGHREDARPAHVVVRAELTRLEDHLEVRGPACLLDGDDLLVDLLVVAGEKRAAVDHHVHLVRARRDRVLDLGNLHRGEALPGRERRGHGGHAHRAAAKVQLGVRYARRVDADGGHRRDGGVARLGPDALGAKSRDLARGVRAFERGQVHAPDGEIERPQLRRLLDRTLGERRRPLLRPHLVNAAHAAHQRAQVR